MTQDQRITELIKVVKELAEAVDTLKKNDVAIKKSFEMVADCIQELSKRV